VVHIKPVSNKASTCIVLQTHKLSSESLAEFYRIFQECNEVFDVYILYDNSRNDFDSSCLEKPINYYLVDIEFLAKRYSLNHFSDPVSMTPGNVCFAWFEFSSKHHYDFYWFIEYDVRFTGNWKSLFQYFEGQSESDLLGTALTSYDERKNWKWWKTLRAPWFSFLRNSEKIRGFFPVIRLSSGALNALKNANQRGWKGHHEVVIPTVLHRLHFSIEDIGGVGRFVSEENINRFYFNNRFARGLAPGTFVCKPSEPIDERIDNKLYHKVIG